MRSISPRKQVLGTEQAVVLTADVEGRGAVNFRSSPLRQVAALPWRISKSGSLRIMLITSRSGRQWIIPKGWPMAGKSEFGSAAQEALEEAGVIGRVASAAIGEFEYSKRGEPQVSRRVRVFPLEVRGTLVRWQECAERKRRWFSVEEAVATVSNSELAALIKRSEELTGDIFVCPGR